MCVCVCIWLSTCVGMCVWGIFVDKAGEGGGDEVDIKIYFPWSCYL